MSKNKVIQGQPVALQFKGRDGEWHNIADANITLLDLEIPDTKEIDKMYKEFLDKYVEHECITGTMQFE